MSETSASLEQEKFIAAIAQSTPKYNVRQSAWSSMNDSSLSINSLVLAAAAGTDGFSTLTPESSRRSNPFAKAVNTLRTSGGKTSKRKLSFTGFKYNDVSPFPTNYVELLQLIYKDIKLYLRTVQYIVRSEHYKNFEITSLCFSLGLTKNSLTFRPLRQLPW